MWYYGNLSNSDKLFLSESNVIKEIAKKESCIIVGRCADYILKDNKNVIRVFVYSSLENKVSRAVKYYGLKEKNAKKIIEDTNKKRSEHYKHYTNSTWNNPNNYGICINSDSLGIETAVELLYESIKRK